MDACKWVAPQPRGKSCRCSAKSPGQRARDPRASYPCKLKYRENRPPRSSGQQLLLVASNLGAMTDWTGGRSRRLRGLGHFLHASSITPDQSFRKSVWFHLATISPPDRITPRV